MLIFKRAQLFLFTAALLLLSMMVSASLAQASERANDTDNDATIREADIGPFAIELDDESVPQQGMEVYINRRAASLADVQMLLAKGQFDASVMLSADGQRIRGRGVETVINEKGIFISGLTEGLDSPQKEWRLTIEARSSSDEIMLVLGQDLTQRSEPVTLMMDGHEVVPYALSVMDGKEMTGGENSAELIRAIGTDGRITNVTVDGKAVRLGKATAAVKEGTISLDSILEIVDSAETHWGATIEFEGKERDTKIIFETGFLPRLYIVDLYALPESLVGGSGSTSAAPAPVPGPGGSGGASVIQSQSQQLANAVGTPLLEVYDYVLGGFLVKMTPAQVAQMNSFAQVEEVIPVTSQASLFFEQEDPPSYGIDRIDERERDLDDLYRYGNQAGGVNAFIMDTGIRATHNDFGGRVTAGQNFDGDDTTDTDDCQGHGTHVAGTTGGTEYGVAKQVTLHPVRINIGCSGRIRIQDAIDAADWITQQLMDGNVPNAVVNMSFGFRNVNADDIPAFETAVNNSITAGAVYVAAAGNDNDDACDVSPARIPNVITVGATNKKDRRWKPFLSSGGSNKGECLDIFAPGKKIRSACNGSDSDDCKKTGTSMAAPHVTGVAALHTQLTPAANPAAITAALLADGTTGEVSNLDGSPDLLVHWNGDDVEKCLQTVQWFNGTIDPWFDGANCYVTPVPSGQSGFVNGQGYYIHDDTTCPSGYPWNGTGCLVTTMPTVPVGAVVYQEPSGVPTIIIYVGPGYSAPPCPNNSTQVSFTSGTFGEQRICEVDLPAGYTAADTYSNGSQILLTGSASCAFGTLDSVGCRMGTAPDGTNPFVWGNSPNFYYEEQ